MRCPYCSGAQGRCTITTSGRSVTECCSCGRVVVERQTQAHDLFLLRAQDSPLCLVTSDLSSLPSPAAVGDTNGDDEDPFQPTGFITAFSTWSLESSPLFARSSLSFAGHLAELERALDSSSSSSSSSTSSSGPGGVVVVDNLRAYLQIIDVTSKLGLDYDISDHAFQLFRDCSSATCLRNRSVEALATAALVQAIREAQEPRTLQELATHIGEVVINKCFCTRRNPISISAAAIYLACQLEDKRKTQAEICKVTGLTEVTLRKVYKELLENWDDLLPANYTPAVPPEKAFPTTSITSGRSSAPRTDLADVAALLDKDKQAEVTIPNKSAEFSETDHQARGKEETESKGNSRVPNSSSSPYGVGNTERVLNIATNIWQPQQPPIPLGTPGSRPTGERNQISGRGIDINEAQLSTPDLEEKVDREAKAGISSQRPSPFSSPQASSGSSNPWQFHSPSVTRPPLYAQFVQKPQIMPGFPEPKGTGSQKGSEKADRGGDTERQ
ncbi:plant-specific TFIIB-related protein 1 isoform X2 [Telopea speciosissima]|uniref:plant-specific TFIIB-related protein 1 isoform X2 n=1 Tax=Telopea speciosissima TaxID=54955 RepID=UPI001CC61742|nr:plant-specific TFIIB-related protein 1 isoform X2 [Telopea speciosissima]